MIIVKLIGGLGNQLFQYSVGRCLAERHQTVLKIDTSGFETYKLRQCSLSPFKIKTMIASLDEINALTFKKKPFVYKLVTNFFNPSPKPLPSHIHEKDFHYNADVLTLPDNIYLDGYWQSEKYFIDIEQIIRKELSVKTPQRSKNRELAEEIKSCQSVSLHIRRGDYVSNEKTNQIHGTCSLAYYDRAIEKIRTALSKPHFFVFSDDPEWVHKNLKLDYLTTIVDHNNADSNYEDLRLMSQCKHNIIANSSFSWWGAWLNSNPDKIVVAPQRWFADEVKNMETADLVPVKWIRI